MTLEKAQELINEELPLIKFKYTSPNATHKRPRVIVIDSEYPGKIGQKSYGTRKDILGVNLNLYNGNSKQLELAMASVDNFAKFLGCNKKEEYERIRDFVPECLPYIRRYNRKYIKNPKVKRGIFYRPYSFTIKDNDTDLR